MGIYYGVDIFSQKEKLLKSEVAQVLIEDIIKKADNALCEEYKALKISDYMLFIQTGDRKTFERPYFKRRNNCSYLSVAYWLTDDKKYYKPLIDLIFHICDEYTWCLPAHVSLEKEPSTDFALGSIDLFQAETCRLLTDIAVILNDKLPYYVKDRIEYEIRRRIIEPLMVRDYGWHHDDCINNWAAVCSGGCTVALLRYATDNEKEKILPVFSRAMDNFLSGFNDDGCCLEGFSYWKYGFSYFLMYATMLLDYSEGKINLFKNDKVKQIALFPQRIRMGKIKTVSFSDSSNEFNFSPGVFSLLRKIYGKEFLYPTLKRAVLAGNVFSVTDFLWFDTDYKEDENERLTSFFKQSQWYVKSNENYSFAVKGGHNDEPHNHNDIGSFMIVTKDNQIPLTDTGCGIYRKETFDPKYRYTLINNASFGHSVPIINGQYQKAGKEFKAENVKGEDTFFEADIEGAYEKGIISKINRRFEFKEKRVVLCDTFEFSDKTEEITERFVSTAKPEICEGYINLKSAKLLFNKEKFDVSIKVDGYRNHADTEDVTVYFIDFKGKNNRETIFSFEIRVD